MPPRLRQNDRERAVGMVQAGMTHQAVADHFNVSRITDFTILHLSRCYTLYVSLDVVTSYAVCRYGVCHSSYLFVEDES
jgi:hypothetical protein